ncbi:hypothetical protein SWPG_00134 [Synechococcus phage S-CBM2]|nr:hypothetical protein SWPG_00134 [Synechococcus phage S-CBM2]
MSEFFNAPAVRAELASIFSLHEDMVQYLQPAIMQNLTVEQRDERIHKVIDLIEKQKVFYFRLCLESKMDESLLEIRSRIDAIGQLFGFKGGFGEHADQMINRLQRQLSSTK